MIGKQSFEDNAVESILLENNQSKEDEEDGIYKIFLLYFRIK
jgi:hypothetical protein